MAEDNIFLLVLDSLDPVVDAILDILPFPINAVVAFIWGGIDEILREVMFG